MRSFDEIVKEITQWQAETFPQATKESVLTHLLREVKELEKDPSDKMEMADVFFLLLALANQYGYDLKEIVAEKLEINLGREWAEPDQDGVVEHVRELTDEQEVYDCVVKIEYIPNISNLRMYLDDELPG